MTRNFYRTEHAPYYIFGMDYIQQSAGIRALHYLCHALNESGKEAYITCEGTQPRLRTPVLTPDIIMRHQAAGRLPIMVYPEIVSGDPFGMGGLVARWLLNTPGHIGGDTSFHEDELLFTYDTNYLLPGMQAELLHIPTCDLSIFNNDDNPHDATRDQTCFYAHKYLHNGGTLTPHVQGAISLCKDRQLTHREIADILRQSRTIYVYEPTALISEALLCGCPVTVIATDYWRQNMPNYAYLKDTGLVMADSDESLVLAKANIHHYRSHYENVVLKLAWEQLDHFIQVTQAAMENRTKPK